MSEIRKNLGGVTAYAYAKSKGYTGTEEEFAELMASYATVAEEADESANVAAEQALISEGNAVGKENGTDVPLGSPYYHNNAKYYAQQAAGSASSASSSASAASFSAASAAASASAAGTSETNAAASATAASGSATTAANSATAAQAARAAVEEVAESIPEDYSELSADVDDLKNALQEKAFDIGSYNRFDATKTVSGIINKEGTVIANDGWCISDYMPVNPGEVLYAAYISPANFALFDNNKTVIANSNNWSNPFTVPSGVAFIRMTVGVNDKNKMYLSTVNSFDAFMGITPYMHDKLRTVGDTFEVLTKKSVVFSVSGFINKDNGNIISNNLYSCTPLIPLSGIVTKLQYRLITYNNIAICAFYKVNGAFISSVSSDSSSLVEVNGVIEEYPQDAAYIRFCSYSENGYTPFIGATGLGDIVLMGKAVGRENVLFAEHDPVTNLIDPQLCTLGYVNGDTDGSIHSSTTFYVTPFIPLKADRQYYFNTNYMYRGYYAFYNADKVRISGGGSASSDFINPPFTTPAGTAYGRFTIISQAHLANAWMCETNQMAEKPPTYADQIQTKFISERPTDYNGEDIGIFTKILCVGDSLTDGFFNESGGSRLIMRKRSYPAKLQELTGVECTNMGYAGYTSTQWYEEYASADLSGHDACIIQLGVNDALTNVSESDMDSALTNIINKVKNENAGIKIFVATIIPANGYMLTSMRTRSQMIRDFVSELSDSDVYLVDLWKYGHTDDFLAYDAGHLSAYGYWQLAKDYKAYISYIVHNNPNDFRYVQFIGTNYSFAGDNSTRQITY